MSQQIEKVRKRDGRLESFQPSKIANAIALAFKAVGEKDGEVAEKLAAQVVKILEDKFKGSIPSVEDIQDVVEEVLMKSGYTKVAKAYILYRHRRSEVREAKKLLGVQDDLKLSVNAIRVLRRRYLLRNERGEIIETPSQMFRRVAHHVALADKFYGEDPSIAEESFFEVMKKLEFLPNSPTLMNAGTEIGQLSACFVIPVEDSIEGIFDALKYMAIVHKSGGGTGFSFSRLRPKGDVVKSTMGVASGPVSFMKIFDVATEIIKQGGKRRGANMGVLHVTHPDIIEFITAKSKPGVLTNFNISVAVTDEFMEAVEKGEDYDLVNPRNGEVVNRLNARDVFELMVENAWRTGDPGLLFIDEINRKNPTPSLGTIESTNPCGEVPLLPFESCNLGSVNLSKMVRNGDVDWDKLDRVIRIAVHFLDNVIDVNKYPLPQIEYMTKLNRKIGLGVMGFAEMLIKLGIPYNSNEALNFAEKIMSFIAKVSKEASAELAEKRGVFKTFEESIWPKMGFSKLRNATTTSIAPTGTISIIANTTSSIEPLFSVVYVREVLEGTRLFEVNHLFEKVAIERGFYSKDLLTKIVKAGSLQKVSGIPEDVKELFVTALDIDPEWHVRMQAAFQKYVDNAVAKTINLRETATLDDVRRAFKLAYQLKCKGITVYRYGSKPKQVLYVAVEPEEAALESSEYLKACPTGKCE
ncbi:MAG: ribonucleotide-diphosphate reductase subunit alpha [Candidatus Methanomethylicota archaeon]|uniref:Vitamin B12-dependent ribonucleotide reductase n=1 Tax=Thermoproteota archaeon TaxID=2056631 RepID=A0A497EWV1_9CREN|nr:MAG: ribonucleotide-diphosphate reductase subunit alpha [Candidatus Verstraetearchaeota archaeon]